MSASAAPRAAAVLLAAGSGSRVGADINKVLLPVHGVPILARSVRTVLEVVGVHRIVLVVRPEDRDAISEAVAPHLGAHDLWVVDGGAHRHDSEWQALRTLAAEQAALRRVAERKLPDLNTSDVEVAMRIVAGTARSMGVTVES